MSNPTLIKTMVAGGTIIQGRIVQPGTVDGEVVQGTTLTDPVFGVCIQPGTVVVGDRVDIAIGGLVEVTAGGTITAGAKVTTDASGKGIVLNPGTGVVGNAIGVAFEAGVSGDITRIIHAPSALKG
jgi:hypothetical protein